MPSIRIGFSTDFVLVNEQVGINTTNPTALLDVRGQIRADRTTGSGGITTLTTYDGFLQSRQTVGTNISIASTTKGNLNSISGEIIVDGEVTVSSGTPLTGGRLDSLTVTGTFDLPRGGSANREVTPEKGSTRFNQDLGQLEFYTGYEWRTVSSYDGSGRGRGINFTYSPAAYSTRLEYINISSTGNAIYFGELTVAKEPAQQACSSSTRGVFGGGEQPGGNNNVIDYITIASQGNAQDFGDTTVARGAGPASCSSSTRGLFAGGRTPTLQNVIDYIQISTIGNAIDFGDLNIPVQWLASCSSSTRGFFAGGNTSPPTTDIRFVTISSTGNSTKFGDLTTPGQTFFGLANSIRGVFAGGNNPTPASGFLGSADFNRIQYITLSTTGNTTDFGDLTLARRSASATSNSTRGVFSAGYSSAPVSPITNVNNIDYITIATTGNAIDFGDSGGNGFGAGCSDSHGGLGGF